MMIMITQRHAQDFFGLVLFDDETIQILFHIARFVFEFEIIVLVCVRLIGRAGNIFRRRRFTRLAFGILEMLPDKIGQLPLEFLR